MRIIDTQAGEACLITVTGRIKTGSSLHDVPAIVLTVSHYRSIPRLLCPTSAPKADHVAESELNRQGYESHKA